MYELKPCPFCGGAPHVISHSPASINVYESSAYVKCRECLAEGPYVCEHAHVDDVTETAMARWNARWDGTCRNDAPGYLRFVCSECRHVIYHDDANEVGDKDHDNPNYCQNCGARVVAE